MYESGLFLIWSKKMFSFTFIWQFTPSENNPGFVSSVNMVEEQSERLANISGFTPDSGSRDSGLSPPLLLLLLLLLCALGS